MKKSRRQRNQIKIVKNKEILIYKNGKKYKHFRRTETKKLNENEMYILDYLLNKYMGNEVESDNSENYENNYNNEYEFELNSNEDFSKSKKLKQSYDDENENEEIEDEERIEESNNIRKSKNEKNKNKKQSKQLYDEEDGGITENENLETNMIKYPKKNKKNKKVEKFEESNEEEENENEEEEESLDTNKEINKKGKKSKISKKMNDSEEDYNENDNDVEEKKIRKRIITRSKEPNNKINKKSVTKIYNGDVVEIKHFKKETKTVKTKKIPFREKRKKKEEKYDVYEENIDNNEEEEEKIYKNRKKEYIPQYITQLQSYTSPTIKFLNEAKAEKAVLNGIPSSIFIFGKEIKGIIFYTKNNILCFISSEGDDIEVNIVLDNIKKIYFNVKGSANIKNYEKKSEERFIQLVEINNKINDIKLNNEEDYENLIKGLIQIFKNKTSGVDKNLIYQLVRRSIKYSPYNSENITNIQKTSIINRREIIDNNETNNNYVKNNYNNINNIEQDYYNKEEEEYNEINNIENNEDNYNNIENKKENEDDDIIITTTITEVFKDGELINKETREKQDGITKSLHVYSPDKDEYEIFLKNTKLGQTQMIKRMTDGLPIEENNINNSNYNINNSENDNEQIIHNEEEDC